MQNHSYKVFISSNSAEIIGVRGENMKEFRERVTRELRGERYDIIEMSDFPASHLSPDELSKAQVLRGQVFVGLVGATHGTILTDHIKSITEEEYDTAETMGMLIHMYVPVSGFDKLRNDKDNPNHLPTPDKQTQEFIDRIKERHTCKLYQDPADLPSMVKAGLHYLSSGGEHAATGMFALAKGEREMRVKNYPSAFYDLGMAVHMLPHTGQPAFMLALALLRGLRPKVHTLDEIRQIEERLTTAALISPSRAIYALHSAVELDYFVKNGFRMGHEDEAARLKREADRCTLDSDARLNIRLIRQLHPELGRDYPGLFPDLPPDGDVVGRW